MDVTQQLDLGSAKRPNIAAQRVNVDFPNRTVLALDREASCVGVSCQSLLKMWFAECSGYSPHADASDRR
jgi:hypothetical protein